jgi:transposase
LLKTKAMAKVISFEQVNPAAAGIDIGAEKIFVSTNGRTVTSYGTFTADYRALITDLKAANIERVCMEATGVYWIALYELLEQAGLEVCLVNPKEVRQVKGRKTDVKDCQWIQQLFAAGLVRQSYVPAGTLKELRMMMRERADIIQMGSTYVNKMSKCLELMNLKLTGVISQIQGASGLRMIEAIIGGERDAAKLLALCDRRIIKAKSDEMLKALEGNFNPSWIFLLQQNLQMWKLHQQQLRVTDRQIEGLLDQLAADKPAVEITTPVKPIRHHKPEIEDLHEKLLKICGVDGSTISGINDYTMLRLIGEVGVDLSRFPTVKHFVSYCQLAPGCHQSGKTKRRSKTGGGNPIGQIFREIAFGLMNSKDIAIGAFMRRLRGRKDGRTAVKAGARKIACAYYFLHTKGRAYVEQGAASYARQMNDREQIIIEKLAAKHGFKLVAIQD